MSGETLSVDVGAKRLGLAVPGDAEIIRAVPLEAPVAIEINGFGYAVMMVTPCDLEAFAVGFCLSEDLIRHPRDIADFSTHPVEDGWIVRITLRADRAAKIFERVRARVSESSCGLCGIESIEQVLRPLPPITARIVISRPSIAAALAALADHQPLGRTTGAVHVAAFCTYDGRVVLAREDVGRHNALDKLIGAAALEERNPASGFILLSSRCSYELVEKTVRAGCPMLVTISAPTTLAVKRARQAGLTLVCLARADCALVLNDPHESIA